MLMMSSASAEESCWLTSRLICCQPSDSAAQINRNWTTAQWYNNIEHTGQGLSGDLFPFKSECFHNEHAL